MSQIRNIFRVLEYNSFRLFFPGLIISQIGVWIQNVAISWLVYDITKSAIMLGMITFLNTAPLVLFAPFAGVIIDRFDRGKLLFIIQILFALQALLMTLIMFFEVENLYNIVILGIFLNTIAALDVPLRQSIFAILVDNKKDLANAICLNSSCFNVAKLLGPAIAGLVIVHSSIKICFLINFLCFVPVIFLVWKMKIKDVKDKNKAIRVFEGLKEGFLYAIKNKQILIPLLYVTFFSLFGMSYPVLIPILTKDILVSDADILGFLMAMAGIGALVASLVLAIENSIKNIKRKLYIGVTIFAISYILIGLSKNLIVSLIAMFGVGFGTIFTITSNLTFIQSFTDDAKRGRVISIYVICFMGTTSLSNFIAGSTTQIAGILNTFIIFGTLIFIVSNILNRKILKLKFKN